MLRVTQVLSLFQNMWKIPQDVLQRKAQIGTQLHDAMFHYLVANPGKLEMHQGTDYYMYLKSFAAWSDSKTFTIKLFEERLTDEGLGLSGQPDAIFVVNGEPILYDFKTSSVEDSVCWRLQGTAYIHLCRQAGIEVSDTFYFLRLRSDGQKAMTFAYKYTPEGWDVFLKAMDCARYFEKWKGVLPDLE